MISQISKGVYVVKPEAQKRYQDTAAGEYTSVFTKARANMWEMSKQQALMNIQEDSARYKSEMALYASRIADMDTRAKALEAAKADYLAGRTTADVAVKKAARAEETDRQKNAIDFQKAGAEQFGLSSGGVSSSTGGTGDGASKKTASTGLVQEWETATAPLSKAEKLAALKEIGGPGGILADLSPAERTTTQFEILDRQHARDAADLELSGLTAEEADIKAAADLVDELAKTDPAMARAYESRGTAAPVTGGTPSASARVDRGQRSAPKFKDLGEMPAVVAVKDELMPSEVAEFDKSLAKIAEERALLGLPPELPPSDYITLARRIAAGRIAGQVGGPAAPFEQQLRLDALLNKSPEDREAIKAAFVASRAARPAPPRASAEELLRGTLSETDREDVRRAGYATTLAAPSAAPLNDLEKARLEDEERKRRMILGEVEFGSAADQIIVEPAAAVPASPARIPVKPRPRAASPETEAFLEENGLPFEFASAADQIAVEPATVSGPPRAPVSQGVAVKAGESGGTGRSESPGALRVRAELAQLEAEKNARIMAGLPPLPQVAEGSGRANIGVTTALPAGMTGADAVMRSTYTPTVAAGSGRANMGMPASGMTPVDVEAAKDVMRKPAPPPPPPTASKYFQNRYEAATDLAQKPDKLARLVASGAGKVVQQIYTANAKTNVPFEVGWQEIALQYSDDVEKLKVAHEILLALDIANKAKIKPKE